MLDELDQPFVRQASEEVTNVGIEYPVYLLAHDPDPQRVQCVMLTAPGPKPVGEPQKVLFVDLVEDPHYRVLDDLILQGGHAQEARLSIRFRYVGSLGRLRSIGPAMDAAMQVRQLLIQVRLIRTVPTSVSSCPGY